VSTRHAAVARLPLLVAAYIVTVGVHVQLGDVTGSDLANRSQFVVADIAAVFLVLGSGGALVAGHLRRWVAFAAWLSFNCLVWGEMSRYALLNKLAGIGLLIWACSAITRHLRSRGEPAVRAALELFISVAAVESAIAVFALEFAPGASMPFHIPLNFGAARASGFMVDPNAFGGLAALALLLSLGTSRWTVRPKLYRLREVALVLGVLLSYSRTVWAATVMGGAYLLVTASGRTRVRVTILTVAAALLYLTSKVSLPVDQELVVRSFTIGQRTSGAESAIQEWRSSPISGIGVGKYVSRHQFIVHNTPLWVLTELGAIGLALLFYASAGVVATLRSCATTARHLHRGLTAGVIGVGMMGLGIEILYQRYVWLLIAIIYAAGEPLTIPKRRRVAQVQRRGTPVRRRAPAMADGRQR
jgi:hypothetical protein